jgi:type IX secretion system PorP/SprF family membrane protein
MNTMKNLQIKLLLVICLAGMARVGYGQQNPVMSHYLVNPYLYNTAAVGQNGTRVNLHYRKQWVDMPDAPDTKILTAQGMFKNKYGLGATVTMDKAHIVENYGLKVSYAYYVRTRKDPDNHYFSIGVAAGFKHQRLNFNEANIESDLDPNIFFDGAAQSVFDADAGFNYYVKGFRLGASVANLAPNTYNFRNNESNLEFQPSYHVYGNAGYDIKFGSKKDLMLTPSVLVRYIPNIPVQFDGNLLFDFKNIFWLGGGYRYNNAGVFGLAGFRVHDMVALNYSYEQSVDGFQSQLGSTHEFSIEIRFNDGADKNNIRDKKLEKDYLSLLDKEKELLDSLGTVQSKYFEEQAEQAQKDKAELQDKLEDLSSANAASEKNSGEKIYESLDLAGTIMFEKNASNLYNSHREELDEIFESIVDDVESGDIIMVLITGTASVEGGEEFNLILSNKRTENARQYLIQKGVPDELIITTFKGNTEALIRNQLDVKSSDKSGPEEDRIVKVHVLK